MLRNNKILYHLLLNFILTIIFIVTVELWGKDSFEAFNFISPIVMVLSNLIYSLAIKQYKFLISFFVILLCYFIEVYIPITINNILLPEPEFGFLVFCYVLVTFKRIIIIALLSVIAQVVLLTTKRILNGKEVNEKKASC